MAHLVTYLECTPLHELADELTMAHRFLTHRAREAVGTLSVERPQWGAFGKRAMVDLRGAERPRLIGKDEERFVEVINMAATIERLIDAVNHFKAQPEMSDWIAILCHPSTSDSDGGNDLVLGPLPELRKVLCEVSDVVSTSAHQNGKERKELRNLGCADSTPSDGVRRFICTSPEFSQALCSPGRKWANRNYRFISVGCGNSSLIEVLPSGP